MEWLLGWAAVLLEFLFGCQHHALSRVFTIGGQTYKVCCDCGAKFNYSLEKMAIEHRPRPATIAVLPYTHSLTARN